jgi:aminoglycoside phosphotransferase (APT) family kinase protein
MTATTLKDLETRLLDYYLVQPETGENARIDNLTQVNNGWASDVYTFTLRYDENGESSSQHLVLKTFADTTEGKDRALKERHALFNLRADRYPVPGVAAVEIDPIHLGTPFVVMEKIDGELLWDALQTADEYKRAELIRLFVGLLVDLHERSVEKLVPNAKVTEHTLVNREVYNLRSLANQYERPEMLPVIEWLYERRKDAPTDRPVITHRDYHPWNVLLTEHGRPFVIDWGWQISDARYDLAWTLTLLERSGYGDLSKEVLAQYEAMTGKPVDHLDYFAVLATTRWLMEVTNSLLFGVNLREGSEDEFRALVADYIFHAVNLIEAKTGIVLPVENWVL